MNPVTDPNFDPDDARLPGAEPEELEDEPAPDDYPDWDEATSMVISGPIVGGPNRGSGRTFTRAEARAWVKATYRWIHEVKQPMPNYRWAHRVLRPHAPGGRYTPPPEHTLPEYARKEKP